MAERKFTANRQTSEQQVPAQMPDSNNRDNEIAPLNLPQMVEATGALSHFVRNELPLVGQISFINALPVVIPIERGIVPLDAQCCAAPPGTLNLWMKEKRLDAGAMSAFFYLEEARQLELIEGLAISSQGAVGSVLLFCSREVSQLRGCDIAVPDSSASSINLLRVLLKECYGIDVNLVPYKKPDYRSAERGGLLLFGDRALVADLELSMHYNRIDLGKWWHDVTGLPMVYGVWAASREFADGKREAFSRLSQALCTARDEGLSDSFEIVRAEAHRRTGLPLARLEQYYRYDLDFQWDASHKEGLRLYETLCRKHKLICG